MCRGERERYGSKERVKRRIKVKMMVRQTKSLKLISWYSTVHVSQWVLFGSTLPVDGMISTHLGL